MKKSKNHCLHGKYFFVDWCTELRKNAIQSLLKCLLKVNPVTPRVIVINRSERVEWITEKVIQIPVGYL